MEGGVKSKKTAPEAQPKYLYMMVTKDEYELPMMVEDSPVKLAQCAGVKPGSVRHAIWFRTAKGIKTRWVRVRVDEDEEEDEDGGKSGDGAPQKERRHHTKQNQKRRTSTNAARAFPVCPMRAGDISR